MPSVKKVRGDRGNAAFINGSIRTSSIGPSARVRKAIKDAKHVYNLYSSSRSSSKSKSKSKSKTPPKGGRKTRRYKQTR